MAALAATSFMHAAGPAVANPYLQHQQQPISSDKHRPQLWFPEFTMLIETKQMQDNEWSPSGRSLIILGVLISFIRAGVLIVKCQI
mgnify:CR=1 FL=1